MATLIFLNVNAISQSSALVAMSSKVSAAAEDPGEQTCWPTRRSAWHEDSGTAPPFSAPERLLLGLLKMAALLSDGTWSDLLYALVIHTLYTAGAVFVATCGFQRGNEELANGGKLLEILLPGGGLGIVFVLMWMILACCFFNSRHRCREIFSTIQRLHRHVADLPTYQESAKKLRRHPICLLVLAFAAFVAYPVNDSMRWATEYVRCDSGVTKECVYDVCGLVLHIPLFIASNLVPVKFVFAGMKLLAGYRVVTSELRRAAESQPHADCAALEKLRAVHCELSSTFLELTSAMSLELVATMAYGTLSGIMIFLALFQAICSPTGTAAFQASVLLKYLASGTVSLVLPCETVQRVLNAAGELRGLLLRPQWQRPELQQELGLFRETVSRDLDTLGDLGLFRLQRSTILSITATIITYIIVIIQFNLA